MVRLKARRIAELALSAITYPRHPKDFLQVFDPLVSAQYTRGVVTRTRRETDDATTIFFKVGHGWVPHVAGQWARIGVELNGRRVWRAYSISAAEGQDPSITVKAHGPVSTYLAREITPGTVLYLERPTGQFVLEQEPPHLLFLVAGSGITPVMSMLRTLMPRRPDHDVVVIYSARSEGESIFYDEILELADQFPGLKPQFWFTGANGRISFDSEADVQRLCPDYRERKIYACGPDAFVTDVEGFAALHGGEAAVERFDVVRKVAGGAEGQVFLIPSDLTLDVAGDETILEASEKSGKPLPHGCRMGICHSCILPMTEGAVTNIRTGETQSEPGLIQTCVSRPAPYACLDY